MFKIKLLDGKKEMQIPLRVSYKTHNMILEVCKENNINRSEFVRFLIRQYFQDK